MVVRVVVFTLKCEDLVASRAFLLDLTSNYG
jgi:hypothetical protein